MNQAPPVVDVELFEQVRQRASRQLGQALTDFRRLFGDVDVNARQ